jgi:hypothetical protein
MEQKATLYPLATDRIRRTRCPKTQRCDSIVVQTVAVRGYSWDSDPDCLPTSSRGVRTAHYARSASLQFHFDAGDGLNLLGANPQRSAVLPILGLLLDEQRHECSQSPFELNCFSLMELRVRSWIADVPNDSTKQVRHLTFTRELADGIIERRGQGRTWALWDYLGFSPL